MVGYIIQSIELLYLSWVYYTDRIKILENESEEGMKNELP